MSAPVPHEHRLLAPVTTLLGERLGNDYAARLDVLEAVAARRGGFALAALRATDTASRVLSEQTADAHAEQVDEALARVPIHHALALTSLARPPLAFAEQRASGAYYTDFRLARFLARRAIRTIGADTPVLDPASGTGILLVAAALELSGDQQTLDDFIRRSIHAADLSADALRGVKLSLASLTSDVGAIAALASKLRVLDSLAAGPDAWSDLVPMGFGLVIGNPPWEKLKVSRHEHLAANGYDRHYGDEYGDADLTALEAARARMNAYTGELTALYDLHGGGDVDMYKLFLSLGLHLTASGGQIAMLVPAGLIRSAGTRALREHLLAAAPELHITVFDNKARFFAIDTRFKFLAVHASLDDHARGRKALVLEHAAGTDTDVARSGVAKLGRAQLGAIRNDLTIPEVRSAAEWRMFRQMSERGQRLDAPNGPWHLKIVREIDMTRDRHLYARVPTGDDSLPLIEGRMVHQFRHSAKAYVSGTGRRAAWDVCGVGDGEIRPQFWLHPSDVPAQLVDRVARERVGFCDITGQTNERAMLAARIPAGVACGNKVPTVTFEGVAPAAAEHLTLVWLAVANSLAYDWLLRRVMTTTVNYFVLYGVPFPGIDPFGATAAELARLAAAVEQAYHESSENDPTRTAGELRAELDAAVFVAYGCSVADARLAIADFPLLDRGQIPLPGEARSTITRDLVLCRLNARLGVTDPVIEKRTADALLLGAAAYVPAQAAKTRAVAPA
jgi:hypothetical protein